MGRSHPGEPVLIKMDRSDETQLRMSAQAEIAGHRHHHQRTAGIERHRHAPALPDQGRDAPGPAADHQEKTQTGQRQRDARTELLRDRHGHGLHPAAEFRQLFAARLLCDFCATSVQFLHDWQR